MAEYDANEQADLQELEGGIGQNLRDNHHSNADEAEDAEPARHGKESDKTLNQNSGQQKKPPSGKAKPKNQQKKSLKDKKSAEASAAKKSSSKLTQKKSKKSAEKSEEAAKKALKKLWGIITGIFGAMSVPVVCILLIVAVPSDPPLPQAAAGAAEAVLRSAAEPISSC